MEWLKEKLPIIIGIVVFLTFCFITIYYLGCSEEYYYTQINNSKIEKLDQTDSMKYKYTLTSYNSNAIKKKLTFKASRKLREKAYLKLKVIPITGVTSWEEVSYNNLPAKVKTKYQDN